MVRGVVFKVKFFSIELLKCLFDNFLFFSRSHSFSPVSCVTKTWLRFKAISSEWALQRESEDI